MNKVVHYGNKTLPCFKCMCCYLCVCANISGSGCLFKLQVFSFHRYQPGLKFSSEFWHELWQEEDSSTACECRSQEVLLQVSSAVLSL